MIPELLIAGFAGGVLRALLAARKQCEWGKMLSTLLASGVTGAIGAAAFFLLTAVPAGLAGPLAAGLAGYVSADVVESLYKIRSLRGGRLV